MKAGYCIPWRPTPSRERHFPAVMDHLSSLLPDAKRYVADSGHDPFNRSASYNLAARRATDDGCDILVFAVADLLLDGDLPAVVEQAAEDGRAHIAYTHYRGLSRPATEMFHRGFPLHRCPPVYVTDGAVGGFLVMRPDVYWSIGGHDEGYVGWGHEDVDFAVRANLVRHPGTIYALWHEEDDDKHDRMGANAARFHARHPDA